MELLERIIKIESTLPTLATREQVLATREHVTQEVGALRTELHKEIGGLRAELHKSIHDQTWKIIGTFITFGTLLSGIVFYIARNVH
ncbi:hypothetical protein [Comamonas suwonensis]|uniref:Hemolysin XhlA n=1 Tax=Comamonas suwonensis TaxID=2606214 RepID=A0A843BAV8_9BURK|nr:hypothetical protein [Comamonas suwonensis]MBI1626024.1 hypothetical protein [Comamonas suwonensis]